MFSTKIFFAFILILFVHFIESKQIVFTDKKLKFEDAKDLCEGIGLQILELRSENESIHFENEVKRLSKPRNYWLGLRRRLKNYVRIFLWNSDKAIVDFDKWAPNEPSNTIGQEDCVEITDEFMWNDINCDFFKQNVACEEVRKKSIFEIMYIRRKICGVFLIAVYYCNRLLVKRIWKLDQELKNAIVTKHKFILKKIHYSHHYAYQCIYQLLRSF